MFVTIDKSEDANRDRIDAVLLKRTQDGDKGAFGELWEYYSPSLQATARKRMFRGQKFRSEGQIPERAEDITISTFITILERINAIPPDVTFRRWLWGVLRMKIRSQLKLWSKPSAFDPVTFRYIPGKGDLHLAQSENKEALSTSISHLDGKYRTCLECYYLEGMTQAEVGEKLGKSQQVAGAWIRNSIRALRLQIKREGLDSGDFGD